MTVKPLRWRVVLVRPRNPLNIGAAARAMANFGLGELTVVKPYPPVWQETRSAVGAEDVIARAQATDNPELAIGKATLVLGTTSGARRNLDRDLIPLDKLSSWLGRRTGREPSYAALLFGSEKTGLSTEEMSYCHGLVRIPTTAACASMNLGQAVAVCCYELARAGLVAVERPLTRVHLSDFANLQSLDHVLQRAARVLDHVGYLKPKSRAATLVKLRRLLLDLELTNHDIKILGGVLAQIEWKLKL
ncbi:MAG TPA: TrmH family RNA methyltransferase [Terriglobia bacterium]|nr:TrmH family RNA methyltransferase [Terriglobia bacterium]